jgi:hypothetical protein
VDLQQLYQPHPVPDCNTNNSVLEPHLHQEAQ